MASADRSPGEPRQQILVADDERRIIDFVQFCLEGAGYLVITTREWQDIVELARAKRPDLILLDLLMPPLGNPSDDPPGCAVITALRADPNLAATPVVLMGSWSPKEDPSPPPCTDLPLDAVAYLYKPFSREQLLARVADPRPGDPSQRDRRHHQAQYDRDTRRRPSVDPSA